MTQSLEITLGQFSDSGPKNINQDFYGAALPLGTKRDQKGLAFAIADGISSSPFSHIASETATKTFLEDYYCTSDAWKVEHAMEKVVQTINNWLYTQGQQSEFRYQQDKGYVCTFSALVLKRNLAFLCHIGDSRIYRISHQGLEQLTNDHRVWHSQSVHYLSKALGVAPLCELEMQQIAVQSGDIFIMATDGFYEYLDSDDLLDACRAPGTELDNVAERLAQKALTNGSDDNLTIQIIRIDKVSNDEQRHWLTQNEKLSVPPVFTPGDRLDGFTIEEKIHDSSRSRVYKATDDASQTIVAIKAPTPMLAADAKALERFIMEEWIARRLTSQYLINALFPDREKSYLYAISEYLPGQTLAQWHAQNSKPELAIVRELIGQVAKALYALHNNDLLHQDIRPENIIVSEQLAIKLIDFGSTRVGGHEEGRTAAQWQLAGTALYAAPEYFLGHSGTVRSEIFSLGVLCYFLITSQYPYGTEVAKTKTPKQQRRLTYRSSLEFNPNIPPWVDETLKKATQINPMTRYESVSEFIHDLDYPNPKFRKQQPTPLLERNPVRFWQIVCAILTLILINEWLS